MKKFYSKNLLSGCAAAMMTVGMFSSSLPAMADGEVYVGYVNPKEAVYPYTGFTNSSDAGGTLYFMVRVEAEKFAQFSGQKLTGLHVGWGMGAEVISPEMEVCVRESLNGPDLASGKGQVTFDWHDVMFDTPYTIPEGKDLYLGGKVDWAPDSWFGTGIFGYNIPKETHYASDGTKDADGNLVWQDITSNDMALLLLGIVQTSGESFNDLGELTTLSANEVQYLDYLGNAWLVIQNQGVNPINSVEISGQFGDKSWSYPLELNRPVDGNSSGQTSSPVQALGTGVHQFWLSKVNGKEVKEPKKIDVPLIGIPESVAKNYTRRPVIEYWVSESEYRTPIYVDQWLIPGMDGYRDRISLVAHHMGDQFMTFMESEDPDVECEEVQMLLDMANGNKRRVFCPSYTLDRSFIPENPAAKPDDETVAYNFINPMFVATWYDAALRTPTFVSLEAKAVPDGDVINVDVKGKIEPGCLDNEPLYLTVYLIEDGIVSTSQEFPDDEAAAGYEGKYTHNDLIRAQGAPLYGEKIDGTGDFSKSVSFDLEEDWNLKNMRVLAIVNRDGKNYRHQQVLNSAEATVDTSGVESVIAGTDVRISAVGGDIVVSGTFRDARVYTLDGKEAGMRSLTPGIYVVKVDTADGSVARKIIVR